MQKKIIALAVAAAFSAPAFADVTPYGIVDAALVSASASGQKNDLVALSGGASTSRLGIKATEDMGNGLTGVAVLEYGLNTETATGTGTTSGIGAARQQMLAVAGGFGTVATGYLQTTGYDFGGKYDVLAGSSASPLQTVNSSSFLIGSTAQAARAQRALAYISPDFGGVKFALNYSTALAGLGNLTISDAQTTNLKTSAYLASVSFDHGPLSVGGVYASTVNSSTNGAAIAPILNSKEFALGGSYDFGVAKALATYQSNTATGASAITAYSVTGVVPVAGDAIALSYAANKMATSDVSATGFTLGYLHTMSKTMTAYAAYSSVKNGAGTTAYSVDNNALAAGWTAADNGASSSLIAVGLRKKF